MSELDDLAAEEALEHHPDGRCCGATCICGAPARHGSDYCSEGCFFAVEFPALTLLADPPLCSCPCGCRIGPAVTGTCAWCDEGGHYESDDRTVREAP